MVDMSHASSAPGLALQSLLRNCNPSSLKGLISHSVVDVLRQLDPTLLEGDNLGRIAEKIVEPHEALRDPDTRAQIVELLPLPKARELANAIGTDAGRAVYSNLKSAVRDSACLSELYSFFGIVAEPRAPLHRLPDVVQLIPHYALFDHQRVAAAKVLKELSEEPRKVVLHMPTGSGKTRTAMHIVGNFLRSREPTVVVWLAQSEELLEQAASEFESSWSHIGNRKIGLMRFWGDRRSDVLSVEDGLIVAGLRKLHSLDVRNPTKMLRLADRASMTVIDEAHQALAPTYASTPLSFVHQKTFQLIARSNGDPRSHLGRRRRRPEVVGYVRKEKGHT